MKHLILLWLVTFAATKLLAVGTVQISDVANINNTGNWMVTANWTGDASNGSVPAATTALNQVQGFNIVQVQTVPQTPAPSANYTLTVTDVRGFDILTGQGGMLSSTQSQGFQVAGNVPPLLGSLTFNISGQSAAGAKGQVLIWFQKPVTITASLAHGGGGGGSGIPSCAAQIQYYRTKPNAGASQVMECKSLPTVNSADYNFPAQSPGSPLVGGTPATIPVAPCPLGVNGADAGHYVYVSGGIGTAEAVLITGGSCTSGASSGTIAFTPANAHGGAWTLTSATGGIQEAMQAASSAGGALILVPVLVSITAPINVPSGNYTLSGDPNDFNRIMRNAAFTSAGNMINISGSGHNLSLVNIGMNQTAVGSAGALVSCTNGGDLIANGLLGYGGNVGIISDGCASTQISNTSVLSADMGQAMLLLDCVTTGAETNVSVSNSSFGFYGNPLGLDGIRINCDDGFRVDGLGAGGQRGIFFNGTAMKVLSNISINNIQLDTANNTTATLIAIEGNAYPNSGLNISITGGWINCENLAPDGIDYGATFAPTNIIVNFSGINIYGCPTGIVLGTITPVLNTQGPTFKAMVLHGVGSGQAFNVFRTGVGNYTIGISATSADNFAYGLAFNANTGLVGRVDMQACGETTAPVNPNPFSAGITFSGTLHIQCLDEVQGTAASAATLAFPLNPNFTITGGTNITAVSGLWAGRSGTLIETAVSPPTWTAGATIGNSCSPARNKPYQYYFDGTQVWLSGSGC